MNAASVAESGLTEPQFLESMCEWAIDLFNDSLNDECIFDLTRSYLTELLAGAAMNAPARWQSLPRHSEIRRHLLRGSIEQNTFTGRSDSIRLIGYFRELSLDVLPSLLSALRDVDQVRDSAIDAVGLFRRMDALALPEIKCWLTDESSTVVYATGRLMTAIGRHSQLGGKADRTSTKLRRDLIETLVDEIRAPGSRRPLGLGSYSAPTPQVPQLCDFLYDCMLKIAGFDDR